MQNLKVILILKAFFHSYLLSDADPQLWVYNQVSRPYTDKLLVNNTLVKPDNVGKI